MTIIYKLIANRYIGDEKTIDSKKKSNQIIKIEYITDLSSS